MFQPQNLPKWLTALHDLPDWIKILATAILTIITTLLVEPFKVRIGNKFKVNQLRKAVYIEMHKIYQKLWTALLSSNDLSDSPELAKQREDFFMEETSSDNISINCYLYAKSQPDVFYQFKDADHIDRFYRDVVGLRETKELFERWS